MIECCDIIKVVEDFYQALYLYALKQLKDEHPAKDAVQEVMYRITQAHNKGTTISNIRAWLYQTLRHVIADHYRQHGKSIVEFSDDINEFEIENSPEETTSILNDGMRAIIQLLPPKYATPLTWSDIDGISQKVVAKKLGISLSAAKMRIQRAREKLYHLFNECCDIVYDKNGAFASCSIKDSCQALQEIEHCLKK
ncbi:RNA polymerase sigma-70 factor (ECF subfamily) [Chitinophaga dinghuensis]|uniref:RNA polymerase sigma-70 factor (ECF subfamily) n=1 Tax=Chitinophaga dinghuensis TaxID=1539050 RepID=A0A327W0M7_9BACT|nr:sigma-70 family RNA polymerase sigma factor [Chitinophaga dinghuensis]RAJ82312.1 RNA polymerase sigma-70 factor (ECF subfamily) [Chitinophaga dinghuensis]